MVESKQTEPVNEEEDYEKFYDCVENFNPEASFYGSGLNVNATPF